MKEVKGRHLSAVLLVVAIGSGLAIFHWQSEQRTENAQTVDHLKQQEETKKTTWAIVAAMEESDESLTPPDEPEHTVFLHFQEAYNRAQRGDPRGFFDTSLAVARCVFVEQYETAYIYRAHWENSPYAQTVDVNAEVEVYEACGRVATFMPEGATLRGWRKDLFQTALDAGDRVAQIAAVEDLTDSAEYLDANPDLLLESSFAVEQAIAALTSADSDFVRRETEIGPWELLSCRADPLCSVSELDELFADVLVAYEYQIVKEGYDSLINRLTAGESLELKNLMADMRNARLAD